MTKSRIAAVVACAAFLLSSIACETATNTNNANVRNTNAGANSNVAVVNTNTTAARDDDDWDPDMRREDFDRDRDRYQREARETGSTVGQGANDLWLWTKTRAALLAEDDLRDSTVNVDVENDVVTLRGTVDNAAQRSRAEQVAKGIEGVKSVRNQLKVGPADADDNGNGNKSGAGNRNARS